MHVGLDFDNTIVCHDGAFHRAAVDRGWIPADTPQSKEAVRGVLRAAGREDEWTELQGFVYGPGMYLSSSFPGFREFVERCRELGVRVSIISHRTLQPFRGPPYDLHRSAWQWLERAGIVTREQVFFEETKRAKLERIGSLGCTHFLDDLPEILSEPGFPAGVERFLFDPHGRCEPSAAWTAVRSWDDFAQRLLGPPEPCENDLQVCAARMLAALGVTAPVQLEPIAGGANNRVFRVTAGDYHALLKQYFRHPGDRRDRLASEYAFLEFAASAGVRAVPRPLARDTQLGLALYEFVRGRRFTAADATSSAVDRAVDVYLELNRHRNTAAGLALPAASEACYSIAEHRAVVARRLGALDAAARAGVLPAPIAAFVNDELQPAWSMRDETSARVGREAGLDLERQLPAEERRLSPSDFGFHNALLGPDGVIRFIDFEYAGWDDPAKLAADFACQPAIPAPQPERFAEGIAADQPHPAEFLARLAVIQPLYRVKWSCILLNQFLPVSRARRQFSQVAEEPVAQLEKARRMLRR